MDDAAGLVVEPLWPFPAAQLVTRPAVPAAGEDEGTGDVADAEPTTGSGPTPDGTPTNGGAPTDPAAGAQPSPPPPTAPSPAG